MRVYQGNYMDVVLEGSYEYAERKKSTGIVGIVAITDTKNIVLVKQYRIPVKRVCIEIPAGLVGDKGQEGLLEGAKRELREETGYEAGRLEILGHFPLTPGMTNEVMTLVLATDLVKVGDGGGDEEESISILEIPLLSTPDDILQISSDDEYIDCKVFMALFFGQMFFRLQSRSQI